MTSVRKGSMSQNPLSKPLMLNICILLASLFASIAVCRYSASLPVNAILIVAYSAPFLSFAISLAVLPFAMRRAIRLSQLDKIEAWWWLSVPYSVGYSSSILALRMNEFGPALAPFVLLYMLTLVSTAAWLLVILYLQVVRRSDGFCIKKGIMLVLSLVSVILFIAMRSER